MYDPYKDFQFAQLNNGLSVYFATWDRPWLKVLFQVTAGAKDDPPGKYGLAHFVEHVINNNVPDWPNEKIKKRFELIGGSANFGYTDYEETRYQFSVPLEDSHLTWALDIFGELLISCRLDNLVERERQVILNEYGQRFPVELVAEVLGRKRKSFFGETRLGNLLTALGRPETISGINQEDLQEFYDRCYTPANINVVAIGGLKMEEFVSALEASPFGFKKPGFRIPRILSLTEIPTPAENRLTISAAELSTQKVNSTNIEIYRPLPATTDKKAVVRAGNVLSDAFFREIREKRGMTYGFRIKWNNFPEAYEFWVNASFSWEHLPIMEDLIDECIEAASNRIDVMEHHIQRSILRFKVFDLPASEIIEQSAGDLIDDGRIVTIEEEIEREKGVKIEDIQTILKQLRRDQRFTYVLEP